MDESAVLEIGRDAVVVMLKISAPIMLISLIVGLIISLFQALTQIQEMTLTFVRVLAAVGALHASYPDRFHRADDEPDGRLNRCII